MRMSNSGTNAIGEPTQDALEHLVVEQLRDLLALEQALQRRYKELRSSNQSCSTPDFEAEVFQLSSRADRLHRMMDAMAL